MAAAALPAPLTFASSLPPAQPVARQVALPAPTPAPAPAPAPASAPQFAPSPRPAPPAQPAAAAAAAAAASGAAGSERLTLAEVIRRTNALDKEARAQAAKAKRRAAQLAGTFGLPSGPGLLEAAAGGAATHVSVPAAPSPLALAATGVALGLAPHALAPQVQVVNGRIVVNEHSLTVAAAPEAAAGPAALQRVEESGSRLNSATHGQRTKSERWNAQDTGLFFRALSQFGTDFSLIERLFPGRTRRQIKHKFNAEERAHPERVDAALQDRSGGGGTGAPGVSGVQAYKDMISMLNQARAQEETQQVAAAAAAVAAAAADAARLQQEQQVRAAAAAAAAKQQQQAAELARRAAGQQAEAARAAAAAQAAPVPAAPVMDPPLPLHPPAPPCAVPASKAAVAKPKAKPRAKKAPGLLASMHLPDDEAGAAVPASVAPVAAPSFRPNQILGGDAAVAAGLAAVARVHALAGRPRSAR